MATIPESRVHDASGARYEVSPLELFFDLVFVFAVSQLSHHLLSHLSWLGLAETLVLLRAAYTVWFTTSWSATIIPAGQARTRWMMLAVTLLGLFMNAAITRAFSNSAVSGWAFVAPFLLAQIGRTVWTLVNAPNAVFRDHYTRTLLWFVAVAPLWIAGAAVDPTDRLLLWALAAVVDTVGAWLAHPVPGRRLRSENVQFDADHMLERCLQFQLIALGETVFTTGVALAAAPATWMTVLTGTVALAGVVSLWALGFGRARSVISKHAERTSDPVRASRHAVNALMVLVAGLIAFAVANELVIAHPRVHTSAVLSLLIFGGPILFLLAQGWYLWTVPKASARLQICGSVGFALLGGFALMTPVYVAQLAAGACLAILVWLDWRSSTESGAGIPEAHSG
jgi:low temperature requirement protein LtrA